MAHTTNPELELDKLVEDMREDIRKKVNSMLQAPGVSGDELGCYHKYD